MVAVVALAAITQVHLSGLVLIPTVSLIAIVFWRRWLFSPQAWAGLVAGGLLALALYAPFLEYERAVGFTDLQATLTALTGGNRSGLSFATCKGSTPTMRSSTRSGWSAGAAAAFASGSRA